MLLNGVGMCLEIGINISADVIYCVWGQYVFGVAEN